MIELDENNPHGLEPGNADSDVNTIQYARCTCLDRGRLALVRQGQHHCAMVLGKLQEAIDEVAGDFELNPNKPVEIVRWLLCVLQESDAMDIGNVDCITDRNVWFREASR